MSMIQISQPFKQLFTNSSSTSFWCSISANVKKSAIKNPTKVLGYI